MAGKEWQLGAPQTLSYKFFDWMRSRLNRKLVDYLAQFAMKPESNIVLEAGSGPAFASSMLNKHLKTDFAVALDLDFEALEEARKRDDNLALVVGDLNRLPFRSGCVDLVWNSSTLEHLPDYQSALKEMVRVTKKGGKVFVGVPNVFGPLGFERFISKTTAGIWIGKTFSLKSLNNLMKNVGLNPEQHIFYFFRFFVGSIAGKP